jgi:hypothetical protein
MVADIRDHLLDMVEEARTLEAPLLWRQRMQDMGDITIIIAMEAITAITATAGAGPEVVITRKIGEAGGMSIEESRFFEQWTLSFV